MYDLPIQIYKYTKQIYKYTNIQIYKYTNIQIYKYTNISKPCFYLYFTGFTGITSNTDCKKEVLS
jgi:hypothetical protein